MQKSEEEEGGGGAAGVRLRFPLLTRRAAGKREILGPGEMVAWSSERPWWEIESYLLSMSLVERVY